MTIGKKIIQGLKFPPITFFFVVLLIYFGFNGYVKFIAEGTNWEDGEIIYMNATQFEFTPNNITVVKDTLVVLKINSSGELEPGFTMHGFYLEGYEISDVLPFDKTTTIRFKADKVGVFNFMCTVICGSGHLNTQGQITVVEDQP
ncbi:MAG: cupredoxin domain-containing protein [Candidatus Thermoplasmatota archaeon]|jgi:heme/copper-type cytochrome/quinol oxidase subunit 2|nr:cupredoxin domain-containing protein [Candidatus Thermoplasmatota archaeon]MDP7264867.1 cupredoxin domain-containing protein [Candidatus Thermoplasmatota archaeon]